MPNFILDKTDQRERERRVKEYLNEEHLLDVHNFRCRHLSDCKSSCGQDIDFTEGQLHHIGAHYSLLRDGEPFRVVVVGQQYSEKSRAGLCKRRKVVLGCHSCKPNSGGKKECENNLHMTGTLLALRFLFEKPFPLPFVEDDSNLDVGDKSVSIFDCFALTNYLLCSATSEGGGSATEATDIMWDNCREHIAAVLHILQPTHLILQGKKEEMLNNIESVTGSLQKDDRTTIDAFGVETHVFSFNHPSTRGKTKGWGMVTENTTTEDSYLRRVVEPVIKSAVQ